MLMVGPEVRWCVSPGAARTEIAQVWRRRLIAPRHQQHADTGDFRSIGSRSGAAVPMTVAGLPVLSICRAVTFRVVGRPRSPEVSAGCRAPGEQSSANTWPEAFRLCRCLEEIEDRLRHT